MILKEKYLEIHLKYSLKIGSITVEEFEEVKLLRITIDKVLNFRKH